jgi:hypothetical protein
MRLTIIRSDGAVYVDSVAYLSLDMSAVPEDVHALQWFDVSGWIEFVGNVDNQDITELPAWANVCVQEWEAADYAQKHPPPPPPPTAEENKTTAVNLLSETDWTALPDVADPLKSNPYLANANEFNDYRNAVRQIAINPVAGDLVWPVMPQAVWQEV